MILEGGPGTAGLVTMVQFVKLSFYFLVVGLWPIFFYFLVSIIEIQ